ncbi:MAG: ribosome biogenesis GTPase Der [Pseudomonadota bacterium]
MYSVAIIGRPNVGKSTLFNRLTGRRLALVDATPGLTRDRREAEAEFGAHTIRLIDTAGLEEAQEHSIEQRMREQTELAITEADLILFVIDARAGVISADKSFAELVRSSGKPVLVLANKCEGRAGESGFYEAFNLGLGEPIAISADHGEGTGELYSALDQNILAWQSELVENADNEDSTARDMRIAIVGRPNAGKSTLINSLLGEERMITGPEAGLTRDSVSVPFLWEEKQVRLFDTAGLRKKARVKERAEKLSVTDALRAIRFAEVVVLLLDATHPFEKQDLQIADLVETEGRALVIALNKWDMVEDKQNYLRELKLEVERLLPQIKGIQLIPMSAEKKTGLSNLMKCVFKTYEMWNRRVPTAQLNRFLNDALARHTPPAVSGRRIRLRYMTQANARPPTFVVFCSKPTDLPTSYSRYLVNSIREEFDMPGIPIRLNMRKGKNPYDD